MVTGDPDATNHCRVYGQVTHSNPDMGSVGDLEAEFILLVILFFLLFVCFFLYEKRLIFICVHLKDLSLLVSLKNLLHMHTRYCGKNKFLRRYFVFNISVFYTIPTPFQHHSNTNHFFHNVLQLPFIPHMSQRRTVYC